MDCFSERRRAGALLVHCWCMVLAAIHDHGASATHSECHMSTHYLTILMSIPINDTRQCVNILVNIPNVHFLSAYIRAILAFGIYESKCLA